MFDNSPDSHDDHQHREVNDDHNQRSTPTAAAAAIPIPSSDAVTINNDLLLPSVLLPPRPAPPAREQPPKRQQQQRQQQQQHGPSSMDPEELSVALREQLEVLSAATDGWLRSMHQVSAALLRVCSLREMAADGAYDCSDTAAQRRISAQLKGEGGNGAYASVAAALMSNISRCAIADHVQQRKQNVKRMKRGMKIEEILSLLEAAAADDVSADDDAADGEEEVGVAGDDHNADRDDENHPQHESTPSSALQEQFSAAYSPNLPQTNPNNKNNNNNKAKSSSSSSPSRYVLPPPSSSFSSQFNNINNNQSALLESGQLQRAKSLAIQRSMFAHLVESSDRALTSVLGTVRDVSCDTVKNALRGQIFDAPEQEHEVNEHAQQNLLSVRTTGAAAAAAKFGPSLQKAKRGSHRSARFDHQEADANAILPPRFDENDENGDGDDDGVVRTLNFVRNSGGANDKPQIDRCGASTSATAAAAQPSVASAADNSGVTRVETAADRILGGLGAAQASAFG